MYVRSDGLRSVGGGCCRSWSSKELRLSFVSDEQMVVG